MQGGTQKIQNIFIKISVFILSCLNISHLQSSLHFFLLLKTVFELVNFDDF